MNLAVPGFFGAIALFLFLLGLLQERNNDGSDETEHLIIIFMFLSFLFCVFAGITMMYVNVFYVDNTGALITEYVSSYRPIGYGGVALAFIPFLMMISKIFDYLGSHSKV